MFRENLASELVEVADVRRELPAGDVLPLCVAKRR